MKAIQKCTFSDFAKYPNLRLGNSYKLPAFKYPMKPFISFISACEAGSRPIGGIDSRHYGQAVSLGGEQIGANGLLNTEKLPYVSFEYYNTASKGKVLDKDILLCKDGALTGKVCLVDIQALPSEKVMVNEHVYVVRGNETVDQRFLFYLMRSSLFREQVADLAFRKKGQPGLNSDHIKELRLPDVPRTEQEKILNMLEPLNVRAQKLREELIPIDQIIDGVLFSSFAIEKSEFDLVEKGKKLNLCIRDIDKNNTNIRFSYRWNKALALQDHLKTRVACCEKLGKYIVATQNGWSPDCNNWQGGFQVLGVDAIGKDALISFDNVKYSNEANERIDQYYVKDGDFLVSRGNTTDLVAMAGVVHIDDNTPTTIFPDLMIRIWFREDIVNEYVAFVFNSSIGRYYFKYSAKGKNQTMVKVSKQELCDFYIPLPPIKTQKQIVDKIYGEIEMQRVKLDQLTTLDSERIEYFMSLLKEQQTNG